MRQRRYKKEGLIRSSVLSTCLLTSGVLGSSAPALAQVISGTITGTVQDASGAVIPGASVQLTNQATKDKRTVTSNGAGVFNLTGLPSGDFMVTVTATGFQTFTEKSIHLDPGDSRSLSNLKLAPGEATQTVTVEAEAGVPLDTGEKSDLITAEEITHLSVEGRDVTELLKTLPGFAIVQGVNGTVTNQAADPSQVNVTGSLGSYAANGNLASGNNLKLDGADITDPGSYGAGLQNVNYDQVAEVKVQTSNFGAENSKGPIVISTVTKSGSDHFHGELYTYARTSQLDSSDALNAPTGQQKDPDHEVYPGFAIGGPVLIPGTKFNHSRALTFFAGAEDYAQHNIYAYGSSGSALIHSLIPTAAMRRGDFSQQALQDYLGPNLAPASAWGPTVINGYTVNQNSVAANLGYGNVAQVPLFAKDGTMLVNGQLPAAYQDKGGQYILNLFPTPNTVPTLVNPFNFQGVNYINDTLWQAIGRVDLAISQRNHFFARYSVERGHSGEPDAIYYNPPNGFNTPGGGLSTINSEGMAANLTTIVSATATNQVFANLIYLNQAFVSGNVSALSNYPYQGAFANGKTTLPELQAYNGPLGSGGLPLAIIPDYTDGPIFSHKFDPEAGDNFTKVWGTHTATFGVYGTRVTNNQLAQPQNTNATNGYISNYYQPGVGQTITDLPYGGNPGANYTASGNFSTNELEGFVGGYGQTNVLPHANLYFWNVDFFANDSWRITPSLTVNLGMRFEHVGLWNDAYKAGVAVFNPALIASGAATSPYPGFLWHAIDPTLPSSGNASATLFYEPRVGFAYDILGNGKTVLRGGWGEYRGHDSYNDTYQDLNVTQNVNTVSYGVSSLYAISQQKVNAGVTGIPFTSKFATTGPEYGVTMGDNQQPLADTYSLTLNQQLPKHMAFIASYVGDNNRFLLNGGTTSIAALDNVNSIPIGGLYKPDPLSVNGNLGRVLTPTGVNNGSSTNANVVVSAGPQQVNEYRPLNTNAVQYGDLYVTNHNLFANYNGVQLGLTRQTGRILFNVNYTFSKALGIRGAGDNDANGFPGDPFNIYNNYGNETFDRRHIFNATYTFESGRFMKNKLAGSFVNNWELSGITTFQSGASIVAIASNPGLMPIGTIGTTGGAVSIPVINTEYLGTPDVSLQPTVLSNPRAGLGKNQLINPAAFGLPNFLQNGQYQLPFLPEPAYFDTDLSAQKTIPLHEAQNLIFRLSAFNFVNHPLQTLSTAFNNEYQLNFTNPTGTTYAQNGSNPALGFGTFPYKTGRRVAEVSLKYNF